MKGLEGVNTELNRLFDMFNERYYNGELRKPIIVAQTNGKSHYTMGWCTCNKVWKDDVNDKYFYEITICSEYLYRDRKDICATLLHEMVHLYCNEKGIKDTSRSGTYHNKKFKAIAESHGLVITYDKRIGWSSSKLSVEATAFIESILDGEVFNYTRLRHKTAQMPPEGEEEGGEQIQTPKQSMRKYVCPGCGIIIRATKDVSVICADCNALFEKA